MSRGPGALQRWLVAVLPPPLAGTALDETATASDLAADYFGARPTGGQLSSVRRALRRLEQDGKVRRYTSAISRRGGPSFWTLP